MAFDIKTDLRVQYEYPSGTWNSIQNFVHEVDIDRGIVVESGVFARPDVSTATVRLSKSALTDLLSYPLYKSNQNFRIQYLQSSTWVTIFIGLIQNVSMSYVTETKKLDITITANDLMKVLLNTRLTNYVVDGTTTARSFKNVMASLSSAVNAIDDRVSISQFLSGASGTTQSSNGWDEIIAGELLNQFLDAELGWCWSNRFTSVLQYATRSDINSLQGATWSSGNLTISNVHSTSSNHVCMDAMDLSYDSDSIVNKVKVTRSLTGVSVVSTNASSVSAYGPQAGDFEVEFDNTGLSGLGAWASTVSDAASPKSIKSISAPAIRRDGEISGIANVDICQNIQVEFAATGYTTLQEIYLITRIGHTITANHWEINLGLWKGI
jgi:hypothetical protein